ncbi:MAG: cytochrome b/b6 domain-containing protein [Rhodobacteraceae bacterium]|nr:cytochrome b/b6 domain-containing protein [Paracoccaceae bacterium]
MTLHKVWDPAVRLFHWSLVAGFAANAIITDPESKIHRWIGYTVLSLVLFRLVWGVVGSRFARFSSFPPDLKGAREQLQDILTGRRRVHLGHTPLGGLMIYNLLATILVICISGYLMTTDRFWGTEWTEELHAAAVTWAELSVIAHITAVILESRRTGVNLPRAMMTGVKSVPDEASFAP